MPEAFTGAAGGELAGTATGVRILRTGAPGHWPPASAPAALLDEWPVATGATLTEGTGADPAQLAARRAIALSMLAGRFTVSPTDSLDELAAAVAELYSADGAALLTSDGRRATIRGSAGLFADAASQHGKTIDEPFPAAAIAGWTHGSDTPPLCGALALAREAGMAAAIRIAVGAPECPRGSLLLAWKHGSLDADLPRELAATAQMLLPAFTAMEGPRTQADDPSLQRKLAQTQKMESLGLMAGMVAHDFNNALTAILGYTSLLKSSPRFDDQDRDSLAHVEEAARRAADLTGRLLSFARGGMVRFGPLDLRTVVSDTLQLAQSALRDRVAVAIDLPQLPVPIEGDDGQLQQALLNILLNARDAMPDGGNVWVRLRAGERATIEIRDDGPGMDEETRTRLFEPFYTTKPQGSGTGLGMAITYGIVKEHGGEITLQTAPGSGTRFIIVLPLLAQAPEAPFDLESRYGDGDLVLVVDDDDMVRRATSATVAHLGYNVVEAARGQTAIDLVRARPDRFAAVVLDLVMPEMTGAETFRELQGIRSDLPVVICTGYAPDAHITPEMRRKIAGLVLKPFSPERLRDVLAAVGAKAAVRRQL